MISDSSTLKTVEIELLANWIFRKNDQGATRLGESRNLKQLARVIVTPKAFESFKNGADLKYAYSQTKGIDEEFTVFMERARNELREASAIMANTNPDEAHLDLSQDVLELARTIRNTIRDKAQRDDDD